MGNPGGHGGGGGLCFLGSREQDSADTQAGLQALSQSLSPGLFTYFPLVLQLFAQGIPFSEGAPKTRQKLGLVVEDVHGNQTLLQVSVVLTRAGFIERLGLCYGPSPPVLLGYSLWIPGGGADVSSCPLRSQEAKERLGDPSHLHPRE